MTRVRRAYAFVKPVTHRVGVGRSHAVASSAMRGVCGPGRAARVNPCGVIRGSAASTSAAVHVSSAGRHVRSPGTRYAQFSSSNTVYRRKRNNRVLATPPETPVEVEVKAPEARATEVGTEESSVIRERETLDDDGDALKTSNRYSLLGIPITPELSAIILVYFVQGILGLSRLAKEYFVKDELGLDPAAAQLIFTASSFPWLVKPLWGFISDSVPFFGYKRKSYLFFCGILGTVGGLGLANSNIVNSVPTAAIAFTMGSLSTAFADVVIDSVVVARARDGNEKNESLSKSNSISNQSTSGSLQSLCWGSVAIGGIVSAYYSGSLIESNGTRFVFGVTALFPLLIACAATLVREEPARNPERNVNSDPSESPIIPPSSSLTSEITSMSKQLWTVGKQRAIWAPTLFVFLWQATPNAGTAMFYFTSNELDFQPEFMGKVALARAVAALAGVGLYNTYFKTVPLKKMFFWSAVLGTGLGLTQLILVTGLNRQWGIDDQIFSLGDSVLLTVLGEVSFLPVLVLAAKICPPGVEATLFAALMSVFNAGGVVSGALGAGVTEYFGVTSDDFTNLFYVVLLCNLSSLVPLVGLGWLDETEVKKLEE